MNNPFHVLLAATRGYGHRLQLPTALGTYAACPVDHWYLACVVCLFDLPRPLLRSTIRAELPLDLSALTGANTGRISNLDRKPTEACSGRVSNRILAYVITRIIVTITLCFPMVHRIWLCTRLRGLTYLPHSYIMVRLCGKYQIHNHQQLNLACIPWARTADGL